MKRSEEKGDLQTKYEEISLAPHLTAIKAMAPKDL